jgi:hypothetical protein
MIFAHIGGVPVEEMLLPLASWAGLGIALARVRLASRVRRRRGAAPRAR